MSNSIDPEDAPPLGKDWFAGADRFEGERLVRRGRPKADITKQPVSLRLDADLVDWFKKTGPGWQTRINDTLRKAAKI